MKSFIIFDVGNVILYADHAITYRILERYGVPRDRAIKFFDNEEYKKFSRGKINGRSFYNALIQKHLRAELAYEDVVHAHNEHLYGIDPKVVQVLSKLPKERLIFLTDTNEWQTEREHELIDLMSYGSRIFRSHEMHMLKTDTGCFPYVIDQLGIGASETVLVDDSIEKIDMARRYGIQTVHFKDANQLTEYLKSQNLM
ncbi:MAG: HAD-IA family hydrolase [Candidatus Woesearchaeota archaeon]